MIKLNFFRNIVNEIRDIKKRYKLLEASKVGDLVWAKMPLKNDELLRIEESHRIRPYLVVHKDFWNIYAYQASSKKSKALNNYEIYGISKQRYKKPKDTWLEMNKLYKLPFYNLRSKFCSLNLMDLRAIEKRLQVQKNRHKEVKYMFNEKIFIENGDVVVTNQGMYYIYSSDNLYIYGFRLVKNKTDAKVVINKKKYYADFKDKASFERKLKVQVLDIASHKEIDAINNTMNSLKPISKPKVEVKAKMQYEVGSVFQVGKNKVVYLFEKDNVYYGVDALMYQLFPRIIPIHNIEDKQIVDIYDFERVKNITEFLTLKNINPYGKINRLYEDLYNCK